MTNMTRATLSSNLTCNNSFNNSNTDEMHSLTVFIYQQYYLFQCKLDEINRDAKAGCFSVAKAGCFSGRALLLQESCITNPQLKPIVFTGYRNSTQHVADCISSIVCIPYNGAEHEW